MTSSASNPVDLENGHAQRREDLLDQAHLTLELIGGLAAVGLVVGEPVAAESDARDVEGDREVRRLFVPRAH